MPTVAERPISSSSIPPVPPLPPQVAPVAKIGSLSKASPDAEDADFTISSRRSREKSSSGNNFDELRLLAVSSQITEISYSISDIQTRIFEIQELRHRSHDPNGTTSPNNSNGNRRSSIDSTGSNSTGIIDKALMQLDARLEGVNVTISSIGAALEPFLRDTLPTPTQANHGGNQNEEETHILRKYQDLLLEWEAVQGEAEVLRDELKEDKWLAVFRTVSEQADGMMSSLDKAITQCQEFIYQVNHSGRRDDSLSSSLLGSEERRPASLAGFDELQKSFEAKKKYYVPSTTKVIAVLDKGIRDRATKNGECLRKHADLRARWRTLRDRIARIEVEMAKVGKLLMELEREPSEYGSAISDLSGSVGPGAPLSERRSSRTHSHTSTSSALARSISPIRKFAAKMTSSVLSSGRPQGRATPTQGSSSKNLSRSSMEQLPKQPTISRRTSFFPFRSAQPDQTTFPSDTVKVYSVALKGGSSNADDSPSSATFKPQRPRWNVSTKPDNREPPPLPPVRSTPPTTKPRPSPSRPSSSASRHPPTLQPPRPQTPSSHARWPPNESTPPTRPSSRCASALGVAATPRARPKTPSHIPAPKYLGVFGSSTSQASDDGLEATPSLLHHAFSPSSSVSPSPAASRTTPFKARRPSASHIPIPSFSASLSRATSPFATHDNHDPPASPTSSSVAAQSSISGANPPTPESAPRSRSRVHQHHQSASAAIPIRPPPRPSNATIKGPPSSYKENSSYSTPPPPTLIRSPPSRPNSRATSRAGTHDRSFSLDNHNLSFQTNVQPYVAANSIDPLDNEIATVVNSIAHGLTIERVDPPLRTAPRAGEEVKAQYAVSNHLGRKVLACRLVVINRTGGVSSRKVMCRVGGGWMDLSMYLLNRQAALGM